MTSTWQAEGSTDREIIQGLVFVGREEYQPGAWRFLQQAIKWINSNP